MCVRSFEDCSKKKKIMEYIRSKLEITRYKTDLPHILFRKLAREIDHETQIKLNFLLGYDLALWLIRLMSFNPKYNSTGTYRLFERDAVDTLIKDYLRIVSGKLWPPSGIANNF